MNIKLIKEILKAQPKTFIVIGALISVNIGIYLYASFYQIPRLEELQSSYFSKRRPAGERALDTASVYRQGEEDLKAWRARIIPKKGFAAYLGSLFETAANNSLAPKGMSYKITQLKDESLIAYTMDFNVTGKYGAVKRFIADLGRMREIMTIDNISLSNSKATEDAVALKVQLTVYLRPEEQ